MYKNAKAGAGASDGFGFTEKSFADFHLYALSQTVSLN